MFDDNQKKLKLQILSGQKGPIKGFVKRVAPSTPPPPHNNKIRRTTYLFFSLFLSVGREEIEKKIAIEIRFELQTAS